MPISKYKLIKQCIRQLFGLNPERELIKQWEKIYGSFDSNHYEAYNCDTLPNESEYYHGEIIRWVQTLEEPPKRTLLAGEAKEATAELKNIMHLGNVTTAGILNVDIRWNFEDEAPTMEPFDLIISQAILEHLLNPYHHLLALQNLLTPGGHLLVHSVTPGFVYHRYPIDACRFYPDFFETFAERTQLTVRKRRVNDNHIFYLFQKRAKKHGE